MSQITTQEHVKKAQARNVRAATLFALLAIGGFVQFDCHAQAAAPDDLAASFVSPPDSARAHTWWHWVNGNVSKAGITLDLEAMRRVGIRGFQLFQVGTIPPIPPGPAPYGSPENLQLLQFAAKEADRLGLEFALHNCPGWSSSGGPWIPPELSMQMLTWSETAVDGGQKISVMLPQPAAQMNYYRDALALAFPVVGEATRIAEGNTAASAPVADVPKTKVSKTKVRRPRGSAPDFAPAAAGGTAIDPASVVDLSQKMDAQGRLNWDAPAGKWIILRIGHTTNGAQNHPAPAGGVGLECDKFSRTAMDFHFDHFFSGILDAMRPLAAKGMAGALIDSYETGLQNWTADFPREFQQRCGYDLRNYLPAMTGRVVGSPDLSERFLWDVRKTQANLMAENYYLRFVELCHERGLKAYIEPYKPGNFDEMAAGAYADTPMGEFWQGRPDHSSPKLAASIGHVNGRPIIGAESFTALTRYTESLHSLKQLGDFMETQGVNRFVLHTFAHQPNPAAVLAMSMGAHGGFFNRNNTWFEQSRAWLQYVARCQYLLQQGRFVADLLYFAGEDSPAVTPSRSELNPPPPLGHDYDTADTGAILTRLKIENGRIVLPDGMSYRLFVLPYKKTITVELLRKIRDLVDQGMCLLVAGPKPDRPPGLAGYPASDAGLRRIADDVWGELNGTTVTERIRGKGRVFWGQPLPEVLAKLDLRPDFEFTACFEKAAINAIHRRIGEADVYFVANRGARSEELVCTFRVDGKRPEFWDANTGEIAPAAIYDFAEGRTRLPLRLDPSGSVFVVFRSPAPAWRLQAVLKDNVALASSDPLPISGSPAPFLVKRADSTDALPIPNPEDPPALELAGGAKGELLVWQNGAYALRDSRGQTSSQQIFGIGRPAEIAGPWRVSFPPNRGAPPEITLGQLVSWTEHADPGVRYFSGTAAYKNRFNVPSEATTNGRRLFLDLGRVQVAAEVVVNGKNLGILWKLPFRVDITDAVRSGENDLEIRVTNLWPNRLIGDEQLPAENEYGPPHPKGRGSAIVKLPDWYVRGEPKPPGGRVTFTAWKHWSADSELIESGLIGPVRLRTAARLATEP